MRNLLITFFSSLVVTWLIIRFSHLHLRLTADNDFSGPQKFHQISVPRIGGISIAMGIFFSVALNLGSLQNIDAIFLICSLPAFFIGLAEDLTKKIGVSIRLFCIFISSVMMVDLLNLQISSLDIVFIDPILSYPLAGLLFTIFAMTGLANAYNIIDGFNGLSSGVGIITLTAIWYVASQYNDFVIMNLCVIMIGAILGFIIWNYPGGRIFLGDSGAYLLGFWIASISILITCRHPEISPWFALLVNGYPVCETIFTIYRRKIHQGKNPGLPDGLHFHTLIYRRILARKKNQDRWLSANARTAPRLWALSIVSILPAVAWYQSTNLLISSAFVFCCFYIWAYSRIIKFKTAGWSRIVG